jgi:uncharacterized protein (TIGR02246 family)
MEVPMKRSAFLIAIYLLLCVPSFAQDKVTIDKLNESFMAAFQKGDMAAIGQMYVDDAYLLPAGAEMVKGRVAIQGFWTRAAEGISEFKLMSVDVKPLGSDAAREIGTFMLKTKGPQPDEVRGKYVVIWQKVGGDWKLATDIWNSDK